MARYKKKTPLELENKVYNKYSKSIVWKEHQKEREKRLKNIKFRKALNAYLKKYPYPKNDKEALKQMCNSKCSSDKKAFCEDWNLKGIPFKLNGKLNLRLIEPFEAGIEYKEKVGGKVRKVRVGNTTHYFPLEFKAESYIKKVDNAAFEINNKDKVLRVLSYIFPIKETRGIKVNKKLKKLYKAMKEEVKKKLNEDPDMPYQTAVARVMKENNYNSNNSQSLKYFCSILK